MYIVLIFPRKNNGKKPDTGEFLSGKEGNKVEENKIELDFSQFILFYLETHESST